MEKEIWKPIPSQKSHEASNLGRIRNAKNKRIVKPFTDRLQEYERVSFYEGSRKFKRMVHTVIAETFLGPKPDGYEIDHINTNKLDNRAENLHYVTREDNRNNPFTMFNNEVSKVRRRIAAGLYSKEEIARLIRVMEAFR